METFKIEGVILRETNFGDANKVISIYTKDFGKLELNAYGCRRAKSPLAGALQLFNHITAEVSRGSKVDTIREADIVNYYANLPTDIQRLSYASVLFEIINRLTLPKLPEAALYELLLKSLPALNNRNARIAALVGVFKFIDLSGIQMNYFECVHCGKQITGDAKISLTDGGAMCNDCTIKEDLDYPEYARLAFEKLMTFDWQDNFTLTNKQINVAEDILWQYVRSIIGKELNSIKFLRLMQKN